MALLGVVEQIGYRIYLFDALQIQYQNLDFAVHTAARHLLSGCVRMLLFTGLPVNSNILPYNYYE